MNTCTFRPLRFFSLRGPSAALLLTLGFSTLPWLPTTDLSATSRTWSGAGSDTNWSTSNNWGGSAPGSNTTDVATFNTAIPGNGKGGSANPILTNMATNVPIHDLSFETSAVGAYVFGTVGGSALQLRGNGGGITLATAVENTQTFNSSIQLRNGGNDHTYSLINNATQSSALLIINGDFTTFSDSNHSTTLTLGGTNTGSNTIGGSLGSDVTTKNFNVVKNDAGTWVLSGANNAQATNSKISINAGTLQFAKQVSLYNADTAKWTAAALVTEAGATLALNVGGTGEFTSADVASLGALGTATAGLKNGAMLGLDTSHAADGKFTHGTAIANTNAGSNVIGLRKLGANTLTLTGANTYTGGTRVDQGTLEFTQNFTMGAASANAINAGRGLLLISTGAALTYGGSLEIVFDAALGAQVYDLIDFSAGSASGDFSAVSISGSYVASLSKSGSLWTGSATGADFSFDPSTGDLTVTAIPELSTWALLLGGAALAGAAGVRRHGLRG